MVDDVNDPAWPRDHITLDSAAVSASGRLRVYVTYGGGCEEHAAALLVSRAFMESNPPRLRARVAHNGNGDHCEALISQMFEFALGPIQEHYQQTYASGNGTVVLMLDGIEATYSFSN